MKNCLKKLQKKGMVLKKTFKILYKVTAEHIKDEKREFYFEMIKRKGEITEVKRRKTEQKEVD